MYRTANRFMQRTGWATRPKGTTGRAKVGPEMTASRYISRVTVVAEIQCLVRAMAKRKRARFAGAY